MPSDERDIRSALLAAATRLLARYGYRRMTVDDLAEAAEVGKGTVYLFFESKEEVALTVIRNAVAAVMGQLRVLADDDRPPKQRLAAMLETRVLGRFDAFAPFADTLGEILESIRSALMLQRERQLAEEASIFAAALRRLPGGSRASATTTHRLAHTLLVGTNSLLPYYLTREELAVRRDIHRRARAVTRVLVAGVAAELARGSSVNSRAAASAG